MSNGRNTFQYKTTISVKRDTFMDTVVRNENLGRKELRVLNHLMTHLDSLNFREVSKKRIAEDLNMGKKDVSNAIETLEDESVIIMGSSSSVEKGYKLLF